MQKFRKGQAVTWQGEKWRVIGQMGTAVELRLMNHDGSVSKTATLDRIAHDWEVEAISAPNPRTEKLREQLAKLEGQIVELRQESEENEREWKEVRQDQSKAGWRQSQKLAGVDLKLRDKMMVLLQKKHLIEFKLKTLDS